MLSSLQAHFASKPASDAESAGLSGGNPFTVGHLLPAILALERDVGPNAGKFSTEEASQLLARALCLGWDLREYEWRRAVAKARNAPLEKEVDDDEVQAFQRAQRGSISIQGYPPNAYLTHLATRALWKNRKSAESAKPCSHPEFADRSTCRAATFWDVRDRVRAWCVQEMRRQLALELHQELDADVMQLAYAAAAWAIATDGSPREPEEIKLAELAVSTFLEAQNEHGAWPRGNPIFHYPRVGNAYCYDFEVLTSVLEPEVREPLKEALLLHVPQFAKAVERLARTSQEVARGVYAWPSGHHPLVKGPESWTTASVFHFLFNLDLLLAEALRRSVFASLERPYVAAPRGASETSWAEFWDCPLDITKSDGGLKEYLKDEFGAKVRAHAPRVAEGLSLPKPEDGVITSAILYGPPGTSKSRIAKNLAESIGWRVLEIDPSHFAKKGLDQVPAEVDRIFDMLGEMEEVVIFVDEFDEMVRERGSDPESFSRMLTTIMLPKLQRIGDRRRCLILMATNHLEQFDAAIRRPGRFDAIIPILPPTWAAKEADLSDRPGHQLLKAIGNSNLDVTVQDERKKARDVLASLTYLEFKDVESAVIALENQDEVSKALERAASRAVMYSKAKDASQPVGGTRDVTWHKLMEGEALQTRLR